MKRPIQTFSMIMAALLLAASALYALSERQVHHASAQIAAAEQARYEHYRLADEFRQSSEDLTRFARMLASTGDARFLDYYQGILDIRRGDRPRPENYQHPYWDMVVAGHPAAPDSQVQKPLAQLMEEAGFTESELVKMNEAIALSEALAQMETVANNAALGRFDDGKGGFTVLGSPDLALAQSLVYSKDYSQEKAKIMRTVGAFIADMESVTHAQIDAASAARAAAATRAKSALIGLIAMSLSVGLFLMVICVVPLRRLTNAMQALATGHTSTEVPCQSARTEFGILARQIGAYKAASDRTAELGEEARQSREAALAQQETALALQSEVETVVGSALEGDFDARIALQTDDVAATQIAEGMNRLMARLDETTIELVRGLTALGNAEVETPMQLEGAGRFAQMEETGETARLRLGELITQMTESADAARASRESILTQQRISQELQKEIDGLLADAQQGSFDHRIELEHADGAATRIANGLNDLMERYDGTISEVIAQLQAFGDGNLNHTMSISKDGRFGELQDTADTTRSMLSDLIGSVSDSAGSVQSAVERMREDASTVSRSMQNQAASIEETSAATSEMTAAIKENAIALSGASDLATTVNTRAVGGAERVTSVVGAVEEIKTRSDRISDIVSVIENISFQTSLLALNASVEAARAGDAGRGFAVVASEVRNLALRAAEAATDIASLISATTQSVDQGVVLAHKAGSDLTEISADIEKLRETLDSISATGRDQATTFQEIEQAVSEINHATQTTATSAERSADLADSLVETAGAMQHTLQRFATTPGQRALRAIA